jgi:hypothetical protein
MFRYFANGSYVVNNNIIEHFAESKAVTIVNNNPPIIKQLDAYINMIKKISPEEAHAMREKLQVGLQTIANGLNNFTKDQSYQVVQSLAAILENLNTLLNATNINIQAIAKELGELLFGIYLNIATPPPKN